MDEKELILRVDDIISRSCDDEMAHGMEDELHIDIINYFCPDWVKEEVKRLSKANFARWCA